jgi:hypothetical protein
MRLLFKLVIGLIVALAIWRWWVFPAYVRHVVSARVHAIADSHGFVRVEMPDDATSGAVLIFTPLRPSSSIERRTEDLESHLRELGIQSERIHRYVVTKITQDNMRRVALTQLMIGTDLPVAFVNGMGKSNPTASEVADELHQR